MNPDEVKWNEQGLAPAVVQDALTGEVLMLAWMNRESLSLSLSTGKTTFWSRSRRTLWVKGETSGNIQRIKSAALDCDHDAILLRVEPAGPACHTGARSCFFEALQEGPPSPGETLGALERVLQSRRQSPPEGSYTAKLFADEALRHKKVGEEASELIVASLRGNRDEITHEAADLLYHMLAVLQAHGLGLADVTEVLRTREGKRRL